MGKFSRQAPTVNRSGGNRISRGICPVCYVEMNLHSETGKMRRHGVCFGSGQSPMKPTKPVRFKPQRRVE